MIEEIKQIIERRNQLAQQASEQYQPGVSRLIMTNDRNSNQVERTLDDLLDFCYDDQMLLLYRKLCRHLYSFNPEAAVSYVNIYREMWDEKGLKFGNKNNGNDKELAI